MRRFGWITLFVLSAFALAVTMFRPVTTLAETQQPIQRTLDVTGRGTLTVKYDTAQIRVGFSSLEENVTTAYNSMGSAMEKVAGSLKSAGVKEDDLQTGMFTLNEEWDYTQNGRNFKGYRVENYLTVTTHDLTKVADLIQIAINAGANRLQGVNFSVKDTDKLVDQALDLAVTDAKAKAERVADRLGAKVVGVYRISVQDGGRGPVMYQAADSGMAYPSAKMAAAPAAPVFGGTTEYTATVSVTFEIQ
ncbi:MAG TPA: SIMPL domain-containing protein [Symbiobacteriaceae bacterium]|nr:SIMPL domain-containing protein [Symbiobacteriaceae bacterium]